MQSLGAETVAFIQTVSPTYDIIWLMLESEDDERVRILSSRVDACRSDHVVGDECASLLYDQLLWLHTFWYYGHLCRKRHYLAVRCCMLFLDEVNARSDPNL
jgi:hypothetical protein